MYFVNFSHVENVKVFQNTLKIPEKKSNYIPLSEKKVFLYYFVLFSVSWFAILIRMPQWSILATEE